MSNIVDPNSITNFWDEMESKDFDTPRVIIGQKDANNKKRGLFCYNDGRQVSSIRCRLLVPSKTRVLYGPTFQSASTCRSDNYTSPSPSIANPISTNCMTCYAAQWGDDDPNKMALWKRNNGSKGSLNKPLCSDTYNLLMVNEEFNPFFISFQKTALKVVSKTLFSRIRFEFNGVPPFDVSFTMSTEEVGTGTETYFLPVFSDFAHDPDPRGLPLYKAMSKSARNILAKQHDDMDAEHAARAREIEPMPEDFDQPYFDNDEEIPF